ncbi:MAG: hypothetical protein IJV69_04950 [Kiritimatiellae bacterium]|nr:hypothetical protein [Kiritimatiellia bacterium]
MNHQLVLPNASYRAFSAPRALLCLPLPEGFVPPVTEAQMDKFVERVGDMLGIESMTPHISQIAPSVWQIALFHGEDRLRRIATYENGRPGVKPYIPRQVAYIVVDWRHQLLYVGKHEQMACLLTTFNGTLFPDRPLTEPFQAFCFNLQTFACLRDEERHPMLGGYPWQNLTLKRMTFRAAGRNGAVVLQRWPKDGFEALDVGEFFWPNYTVDVAFHLMPESLKKTFSVTFFQEGGIVRAALSERTLPSIAKLVDICAQPAQFQLVV